MSFSLSLTPNSTNNGDRKGIHWGMSPLTGSGWQDATAGTYPDWLQVEFDGSKTIDEIDVFTAQDAYWDPGEPTESMTCSTYNITNFDVQYWNGSSWLTVPGGSVTGNNKVWRKFTFTAVTTTKIRVVVNGALSDYSRIVEVEAWGSVGQVGTDIKWLVADQLGTPRMVLDQSGELANVKRHDYLPFGEELLAPTGGRTAGQGYAADGVREQFTGKERDIETGLDYFLARYYSSSQGRFVSVDPLMASAHASHPQTWNRYSYVLNNPLRHTDPTGMTVTQYDQMSQAAIEKRRWFHAEKQAEQPADTSSTPAEQPQPTGDQGQQSLDEIYKTPPCTVAGYDQLSPAQTNLIGPAAYNELSQLQQAVFVNITGALAKAGANLSGLKLSSVENDRLLFSPSSSDDFRKSITAGTKAKPATFNKVGWIAKQFGGHDGMDSYMVRENVAANSLQVGFGKKGAFADIDLWNPQKEFGKHQDEVKYNHDHKAITPHFYLARVFGNCK